ncbi:MAG: glutamate 5-kinase [Eubacteriales bacterium]
MKLVIKVGTSTLTHPNGRINIRTIESLVRTISDLKNMGHSICLVSSGSIGMGMGKLLLTERPEAMDLKQASAAVGQCELMFTYSRLFGQYSHTVGQVLLTGEDVEDYARIENFQNTVNCLLKMGVLPIINENDTVSTKEIAVGDNDTLGAIVATNINADMMIVLSDIAGLYTADPIQFPEAQLIRVVEYITPEIEALAGTTRTKLGSGGMATKLKAAKMVTEDGCDMVIVSGKDPTILYDVIEGKPVGTRFPGRWSQA